MRGTASLKAHRTSQAHGAGRGILCPVSRKIVFALVLIAALWQGPAWAYLDVAGIAGSRMPAAGHCLGAMAAHGEACNDCCGGGCDPACQSACGFSCTAALPLELRSSSAVAPLSQPSALPRTPIISFDPSPPVRPPIR